METIKLIFSESQLKHTMHAHCFRKIGLGAPIATALLFLIVIYRIYQGDRSWYVGFMGAVVLIFLLMNVASYIVHLRRSVSRFKRMKSPEATMDIYPKKFRIQSDLGAVEMNWEHVDRVERFPHGWLLVFFGDEFLTLPLAGLSDETKQLILRTAELNGAEIT